MSILITEIGTSTNSAALERIVTSTESASSSMMPLSSVTLAGEDNTQSIVATLISLDHGGLSSTEVGNNEHFTITLSNQTRLTVTSAAGAAASYISPGLTPGKRFKSIEIILTVLHSVHHILSKPLTERQLHFRVCIAT